MEQLSFLWHWHFLLGLLLGWKVLPYLIDFVKKFIK